MAGNNAQRPGKPSEQELSDLSKELGTCWELLGIQLDLAHAVIENIKGDNVQYPSLPSKAYAMLMKWHDKGRAATYRMLAKALRHEDKQGLAEKYCETTNEAMVESPATEVLALTPERKNFLRLVHLLISGGTQILREVFDSIHPPSTLPAVLGDPEIERKLKKLGNVSPQWKCLYPSRGGYGKSTDFDISLLSVLLIRICNLKAPQSGRWDTLPASTDQSVSDDLVRIKYYCDTIYAHVTEMEISNENMERLWEDISEALGRLAGSVSKAKGEEWKEAMTELKKNVSSTREVEHAVEKLKVWCNMEDEVKAIRAKQGSPTVSEISALAPELGKDWKPLSQVLGIKDSDVKHESQPSRKAYQTLVTWIQHYGKEATYIWLASGLRDIDRKDLADRYCYETCNAAHVILPISYSHFVNRVGECQRIKSLLNLQSQRQVNVISISGLPGMGKTSTALKVANDLRMTDSWEILYANCRPMRFLDELAHKIVKQLTPMPSDKPISEALPRLCSRTKKTLLVLDNCDNLLYLEDEAGEKTRIKEDVSQFVSDIAMMAKNVAILMTSRKGILLPAVDHEAIALQPLSEEHSSELLESLECKLNKQETKTLLKLGEGTPLTLRTLAFFPSGTSLFLQNSPPGSLADFWVNLNIPEKQNVTKCIIKSFEKLGPSLKEVLVQLAVFKGPFTMERARHILSLKNEQQTGAHLMNLITHSLLAHHTEPPGSRYSLLTTVKDVCVRECKKDPQLQQTYDNAKRRFILHYMQCLEELFQIFYSVDSLEAIKTYQEEEENIKQLLQWCAEDPSMDDSLRNECVDTFNKVGELLAKLIRRNEFERIFAKLGEKCKGDEKRMTECCISVGIKIIFSCSCSPKLCAPAKNRAKDRFVKALEVSKRTDIADNSRAQCLAKLGRCYALEGNFRTGQRLIEQALEIRTKNAHKDPVMLAATYNDLAVAQTLNGKHDDAIQTRRGQTLKVYDERLKDHPFTATILNNIGNNYHELKKFESAIKYFKEALEIRSKVLGDHQDTAKSLYDLGIAHNAQGSTESPESREKLEKALQYIQQAALMQEKVSDTKEELFKVYRQLVEVLKKLGREGDAEEELKKVKKCEDAIGSPADSRDVCCTSTDQTDVDIH